MQASPEKALLRAQRLCSIQERSQHELREKLTAWGLRRIDADHIITQLITDGFLNEARFATAYAGGKFRIMGWGPGLIRKGLRHHRISEPCIRLALNGISETELVEKMRYWIQKRKRAMPEGLSEAMQIEALNKFLFNKGFSAERRFLSACLKD